MVDTSSPSVVAVSPAVRASRESAPWVPRTCVWELTLACNLRCLHCGSVAGRPRADELPLETCLRIVGELADLGCELVTLSGGEPTLRRDWDVIARAIADRGMYVNMVTHGAYRDASRARDIARRAIAAGLCNVGVSVDGPREIHDQIRGAGNFDRTLASIRTFVAAGLSVGVLTTVNRLNLPHLDATRCIARDAGARQWRVQLGKPMGSLALHDELVISPRDLLVLIPELARMARLGEIRVEVGDSIGYYGPHDAVLRGTSWQGQPQCWRGCQAGLQAIGIEADGTVKGCLSLQARWGDSDPFAEGNLRDHALADLWFAPGAFAYNRKFSRGQLTGACARCPMGEQCRGGARCVSAATLQRLTEDPYCWLGVSSAETTRTASRLVAALGSTTAVAGLAACIGADRHEASDLDTRADTAKDSVVDIAAETVADVPTETLADVATDATTEDGTLVDANDADATDADTISTDSADAADSEVIDCTGVCCACDYGVLPDDVWQACCAVCKDACCECEYGVPPPPQCCTQPPP